MSGYVALVPTAVSIYQGLTENKDDPVRFAEAEAKYNAAISGDQNALCFLRFMSGRYGSGICPDGTKHSGYATDAAKDYAYKLYHQAMQVLGGTISPQTPIPYSPAPSQDTGLQTVSGYLQQGADVTAKISGVPTSQERMLIAIAVVALVVFLIARKS